MAAARSGSGSGVGRNHDVQTNRVPNWHDLSSDTYVQFFAPLHTKLTT